MYRGKTSLAYLFVRAALISGHPLKAVYHDPVGPNGLQGEAVPGHADQHGVMHGGGEGGPVALPGAVEVPAASEYCSNGNTR